MSDEIAKIRARWAKATPGPWKAEGRGVYDAQGACVGRVDHGDADADDAANRAAIAAAPSDVAFLLGEAERLRSELGQALGGEAAIPVSVGALRKVYDGAFEAQQRAMWSGPDYDHALAHDAGLMAVYVEARKAAMREYLDQHGPSIAELTERLKAAEARADAERRTWEREAHLRQVDTKNFVEAFRQEQVRTAAAEAERDEYREATSWEVACLSCGGLLSKLRATEERAERAEAEVERLRGVVAEVQAHNAELVDVIDRHTVSAWAYDAACKAWEAAKAEVETLTGKLDLIADAERADADYLRDLARECASSARLRAAGKCDLCERPAPCGCSYAASSEAIEARALEGGEAE